MLYFENVNTLDELKKEYRRLAMIHHPDVGGTVEAMQEINAGFEAMFPLLRMAQNKTTETASEETAASYRSEFYTANGWKGTNYDAGRSLKEIAQLVRKFIKDQFPTYKFSVRTKYASMCQELIVEMREAPCKVYKGLNELTKNDIDSVISRANRNNVWSLTSWTQEEALAEISRLWQEEGIWYKVPTDQIRAAAESVDSYVKSYNFSDCDGMIDYFDVNFYYFGCLQGNANSVQFVPKTPRISAAKGAKAKRGEKAGKPQEVKSQTPEAIRVVINPEFDGIEVYFPVKPCETTRAALKEGRWRWHRKKGCWYNRNTEDNLQQLRAITEAPTGALA